MEGYTKEQCVIIVKKFIKRFITKLNLALLLGHPIYIGATDTRGEVSATAVLSKPFSRRLQNFAVFFLSLSLC